MGNQIRRQGLYNQTFQRSIADKKPHHQKIADGKATKIYLPLETSGILGSIGGVSDLFKDTDNGGETQKAEELIVAEDS